MGLNKLQRGWAGPGDCHGRQSWCRGQHAALSRSCGSVQAVECLASYCSLGAAERKRTGRMACLVMEIFPLATWSLYSFTFSWLLTRKQTTASLAEKGLGSIARMPPPQCSPSMLPPNLFRKVFGALIKNLKLLSGLKGLNPLCFLASLHPLWQCGD